MATVIQLKRSSTQNDVPTTSDLSLGELAVNTYHGVFTLRKMTPHLLLKSNFSSLTINGGILFNK